MNNINRLTVALLLVLLIFGLAANVGAEGVKLGYVTATITATSQAREAKVVEEWCEEKDWDLTIKNANGSWAEYTNAIETFVQSNVDAIIVSNANLPSIKPAIEAVNKADIPLIAIDSGWAPGVLVNITSNNFVMGAQISSYLMDRLGGKGNIVAVKFRQHFGCRRRGLELDTVLSEFPEVKLLDEHEMPPAGFVEDTQATMETWLTRYGDEIDAVFCVFDDLASTVALTIEAAGYTKDDIFVVGIDGTQQAYDLIRRDSPFVATIAQPFEGYAEKALEIVEEIVVKGVEPEKATGGMHVIYLNAPLITEANVPDKGKTPFE
ncbi:MAG: ribose transport system substrate-binding protein [Halanaerobiales bacterium]|nr:ribose transport system substrate-binding protein [Halanaerobiales bacterium]